MSGTVTPGPSHSTGWQTGLLWPCHRSQYRLQYHVTMLNINSPVTGISGHVMKLSGPVTRPDISVKQCCDWEAWRGRAWNVRLWQGLHSSERSVTGPDIPILTMILTDTVSIMSVKHRGENSHWCWWGAAHGRLLLLVVERWLRPHGGGHTATQLDTNKTC